WGWSSTPPPDAPALDALAWGMARLNGTPRSSVSQHNRGAGTTASGILDDTAYGLYNIPALTLNVGDIAAPSCPDLETLWSAQRPTLLFATKDVGLTPATTFSRPFGPVASSLAVTQTLTPDALTFTAV